MNKPYNVTQAEIDFLRLLSVSELECLLREFPVAIQEDAIASLMQSPLNEREKDEKRRKEKRSEAARIFIPDVVDWNRRERSLADPEKFLKEYFSERYTIPFGPHHYKMIDTLISRAKHGGRQAVAAPRGCGKSEIFKGLLVFLILSCLVRFPLLGAATSKLGRRLYQDFRTKIATNDLLLEDFPEVCYPVRALEGAPQRAGRQHIDGVLTNIVWTANDYLRLPDVPGSPYGGVKVSFFGLDQAFRGVNIDGDRPDFVPIDDPETRESAKSYEQGVDRELIIDQDVAGLASQEKNLAIVVLTTVQNCYCLSYRITDPQIKPAFNGLRYGMIVDWPADLDRWNEYISIRHKDQSGGDEFGTTAVKFYLANRAAMDAGVKMLSDHFVPIELEDGTQLVYSAIQQAFNKIANTSLEAYKTEYQNSPTAEEEDKSLQLTAALVANRISGLERNDLPPGDDILITMGIDIGDFWIDWVKVAWFGNATGVILDYGIIEVPTMKAGMSREAKLVAIYKALISACPDLLKVNPPDFCLIDSGDGDHTDAVYRAVKDLGGIPFAASKGWDSKRFRMPKITTQNQHEKKAFRECWAGYLPQSDIWLYNVHTEDWKHTLQKAFLVPTFDENQWALGNRIFNDGSLSLFRSDDRKCHLSISHHIVAEKRERRFVDGKGWVVKWNVLNRNNHKLDATALACCAAGCLGIELLEQPAKVTQQPTASQRQTQTESRFQSPHGRSFLPRRE